MKKRIRLVVVSIALIPFIILIGVNGYFHISRKELHDEFHFFIYKYGLLSAEQDYQVLYNDSDDNDGAIVLVDKCIDDAVVREKYESGVKINNYTTIYVRCVEGCMFIGFFADQTNVDRSRFDRIWNNLNEDDCKN